MWRAAGNGSFHSVFYARLLWAEFWVRFLGHINRCALNSATPKFRINNLYALLSVLSICPVITGNITVDSVLNLVKKTLLSSVTYKYLICVTQ